MLRKTVLFTLANALLALAAPQHQAAVPITNNPNDIVYRADFPTGNSQTVVGVIQFYSLNGTTKVHVDITGLPKNSGIFSYHIHDAAVGPAKNCAETASHFNPYNAPKNCDSQPSDAYCAIGDLSGKHGLINTTCFETFYYDPYLSLDPASPQFIGGKSINIHLVDKNEERLACATIKSSREPEDLLLLNKDTEAKEVQKYEELSGVKVENLSSNEVPLSVASFGESEKILSASEEATESLSNPLTLRGEETSEKYTKQEEFIVEEEDDDDEVVKEDYEEDEELDVYKEKKGNNENEGVQEKELNELINEDLEKNIAGNSSDLTNASNVTVADQDENGGALSVNLSVSTIISAGAAALISFLF